MDRAFFDKIFSSQRMQKFFDRHPADEVRAMQHYQNNILISESFYPLLTVFEVALRNALNRELITFFGTDAWHHHLSNTPGFTNLNRAITNATRQIAARNEQITTSKLTAELNLGFWVRLLNVEYEMILWKPLRRAFPFMPKEERRRHNVSAPLNRLRDFRNRIFHHEPICWKLEKLEILHAEIYSVIGWINKDLPEFVKPMDRVLDVIIKIRKDLA